MTTTTITHPEGVSVCERILRQEFTSRVVLTEPSMQGIEECPDALGVLAESVVLDWKCSLDDARAHLRKPFVECPRLGMGQRRFLVCEPHVVSEPEVADWPGGIIWWHDGQVIIHKGSPTFHRFAWWNERAMLCQALSNAERSAGKSANDARKSAHNTLSPDMVEAVKAYLAECPNVTAAQIKRDVPEVQRRFRSAASLVTALTSVDGISVDRRMGRCVFELTEE